MNNKIIDRIALSNGFQSGQWVATLALVDGTWVSVRSQGTGECTWQGDAKVSEMNIALEGKGLVGGFNGHSPHTYIRGLVGFFGFTVEELDSPAPERGYTSFDMGVDTHDWKEVVTLEDYLIARFVNCHFRAWREIGDGVHEMPYEWGSQDAGSFALVIGGKLVEAISGSGDMTPWLSESKAKCLAASKLHTSSDAEERAAAATSMNDRNNAALKAGWSEEWQGVADHLRSSYRIHQNPLPGLRKKYPGKWVYHCPGEAPEDSVTGQVRFTALPQRENETAIDPRLGYASFWGNVWSRWQVSYIPTP